MGCPIDFGANHLWPATSRMTDIANAIVSELENKRTNLLDKIYQIQPPSDSEVPESNELVGLKIQYNEVVNQIEIMTPSPLKDPLKYLPREIWEHIIFQSACPDRWFADILLDLANVSKTWEAEILSTPIFWAEITISSEIEDMEAKLALCAQLSADSPLRINLELPMPLEPNNIQVLQGKIPRIRSLVLSRKRGDLTLLPHKSIQDALALLGSLVLLEDITSNLWGSSGLNSNYPNLDLVLQQARSLKSLSGIPILPATLALDSLQTLRAIETDQAFKNIFPYLRSLPSLHSVTLARYINKNYQEESRGYTEDTLISPGLLPWLSLNVRETDIEELSPILGCVSSTLLELRAKLSWEYLTEFLSTCGQMKRLQLLEMGLPPISKQEFSHFSNEICITNINQLTINIGNYLPSYDVKVEISFGYTRRNIRRLFEIIPDFAPKIKELNVTTVLMMTPAPTFAQNLPNLTRVSFQCTLQGSFEPLKLSLPTAERVEMRSNNFHLWSIHCPKALDALFYSYSSFPPDLGTWHSITILAIDVQAMNWRDVSLPHLEKVILGTSEGFFYHLHSPIHNHQSSYFIAELALCPTSFPKLRHIEMKQLPEWDILFLMLERRNFLTGNLSSEVSPIKVLTLPLTPHISILRPLSDRLRGHFSERPSNLSLSLQAIADVFFDSTITGCEWCLMNFSPCKQPLLYRSTESSTVLHYYPTSTEDILSTQVERLRALQDAISRSAWARFMWCQKVVIPTEITGYTGIGLPEVLEYPLS